MGIRWFAALAVAAVVGAPSATTVPAALDGAPTSISDHPWVVSLIDRNGFPFCDGTLTAPATVLTAAHCLIDRDPADVVVIGGRTDLSQIAGGDRVSGVTRIDRPRSFASAESGGDIARLTLRAAFPYRTLPLATTTSYPPGTTATVLGWAALGPGSRSTMLHEAQVPIDAERRCGELFDRFVPGTRYDAGAMFCAGGTGTSMCGGDAGAPLVVAGRLAGIASWSIGCGEYPDFFTKVSSYPNG